MKHSVIVNRVYELLSPTVGLRATVMADRLNALYQDHDHYDGEVHAALLHLDIGGYVRKDESYSPPLYYRSGKPRHPPASVSTPTPWFPDAAQPA